MPEFTGLDLLREIRAINPNIEVIFLSAYADFKYASFGIDHKIFKYMLKPLTVASLTETLTALSSHLASKKSESSLITFQNYMNPSLQKALYDYIYKTNTVDKNQLQDIMTNYNFPYNLSSDYMTIIDMNLIELDSYLAKNNDVIHNRLNALIYRLLLYMEYPTLPFLKFHQQQLHKNLIDL